MTRVTKETLNNIKKKCGVDILWSWSRINTFQTSPFEYYLKYVLHKKGDNDTCAYAPIGSLVHSCLEKYYSGEIRYEDMIDEFEDGWITSIDIADLKFDRNDDAKNASIKEKYKYDIGHFLRHHNTIVGNVLVEKFVTADIEGNILQGYIDAIVKDMDGKYCVIDFKTSTKFSSKQLEEKSGQLTVYAISLMQKGIPIDMIRIGFNMLKYCTIEYHQKNGAVKTRDVERCKIGESLQTNAKMWMKDAGYSEKETDECLKQLIDFNDISVLPKDIQNKYKMSDCYIWVPLTQKLVDKWCNDIVVAINDINNRVAEYNKTQDEYIFWDSEDDVKKESYYFATLCEYSSAMHKPYAKYLETLEQNADDNLFIGSSKITTPKSNDDDDLSWLNDI